VIVVHFVQVIIYTLRDLPRKSTPSVGSFDMDTAYIFSNTAIMHSFSRCIIADYNVRFVDGVAALFCVCLGLITD
jgi:hypothetical protein